MRKRLKTDAAIEANDGDDEDLMGHEDNCFVFGGSDDRLLPDEESLVVGLLPGEKLLFWGCVRVTLLAGHVTVTGARLRTGVSHVVSALGA